MKILIVEDDLNILSLLKEHLKEEGFIIDVAQSGADGEYLAILNQYDVIILDWMLPEKSGIDVLKTLREKNITTPVIILTAKGDIEDKIKGLKTGADDYLPKPFSLQELQARIEAIYRRIVLKGQNIISIKDIVIDTDKKIVKKKSSIIDLTAQEYELLMLLVKRKNSYVSKMMIEEYLWNNEKINESNLVPVIIYHLRKKLGKDFIKSIKVEDDVSLIISSSHAVAKYVSSKNVLHISYFQARNLKYIWEEQGLYFSGIKKIFKVFVPYLQKFDLEASKKPDYIVANSKFVQKWIKDTYYRESTVIYPPVDVDGFDFIENKDDYYVTVGRLEPYKRFDIIVDAFNELNDKKLIVIGDGSQRKVLQKKSGGNITFTGFLEKSEVNKYISKAKCFIFAGIEDFGIASVEAQACGTPVICLNQAGTAETSIDGITGIHFMEQNFESLLEAVEKFEKNSDSFEPKKIRANALRFSKERFEKEIKEFVEEKYEIFKKERN
jgi:DNA-binding response OmpR family regulator